MMTQITLCCRLQLCGQSPRWHRREPLEHRLGRVRATTATVVSLRESVGASCGLGGSTGPLPQVVELCLPAAPPARSLSLTYLRLQRRELDRAAS
jgi:hypothetical protein